MARYEVIVEIKWTGRTSFPVYLEAPSAAEAMEMAQQAYYDDVLPDAGDLEIEQVTVVAVQEDK